MKERIIDLLRVCMQAHEKGFNIEFSKGIDYLSIWDLTPGKMYLYVVYDDLTADAAESYLKGLINE